MNWLDQIGGVLQQYATPQSPGPDPENDFDHVSNHAPPEAVSSGLAAAFRSSETPAFGSMLSQLFDQSSGSQRANILNTLLAAAGPELLSALTSRGGVLGRLGEALHSGQPITPEAAEQVSPQVAEELAHEAEKRDPTVIDRVSDFYSQHPNVVKGLGAAALAIVMSNMAGQRRGWL